MKLSQTCRSCGKKYYTETTCYYGDHTPVYKYNIETMLREEIFLRNEVCEECSENVMTCHSCKEYVLHDQMRMNVDENLICAFCFEMQHPCILEYNDRPKYTFYTEQKSYERCSGKILYFGIELETEGSVLKNRTINSIIKQNNTFFDGYILVKS